MNLLNTHSNAGTAKGDQAGQTSAVSAANSNMEWEILISLATFFSSAALKRTHYSVAIKKWTLGAFLINLVLTVFSHK